jgi:hypothetical protein
MKKGAGACDALASGRPISILHLQGRYMPGETAEQWRGEGVCERVPLDNLIDRLPHYTITAMVSTKRIEDEKELVSDLHKEGVTGVRCCIIIIIIIIICVCGSNNFDELTNRFLYFPS